RRIVREAWQVDVRDTYGATEYAPIAAECERGRKHLLEDGAVIEIVDEQGRPVPPGVSGERVLLTVFHRRTQPLIRYEITDMMRLTGEECACGRPFRVIDGVEGRLEDILYFGAQGSRDRDIPVHPNAFHGLLETVPSTGWQVIHTEDGL